MFIFHQYIKLKLIKKFKPKTMKFKGGKLDLCTAVLCKFKQCLR